VTWSDTAGDFTGFRVYVQGDDSSPYELAPSQRSFVYYTPTGQGACMSVSAVNDYGESAAKFGGCAFAQ
jgi:hypothetical protein